MNRNTLFALLPYVVGLVPILLAAFVVRSMLRWIRRYVEMLVTESCAGDPWEFDDVTERPTGSEPVAEGSLLTVTSDARRPATPDAAGPVTRTGGEPSEGLYPATEFPPSP